MESNIPGMAKIRRVAASALALGTSLVLFGSVTAQESTPVSNATANQPNFGPFSPDVPIDSSRVLIVLMIFLAALAIAAVVAFVMRNENRETRNWIKDLLAAGHTVTTDQVAAVLSADQGPGTKGVNDGQSQPASTQLPPITVLGPTTIVKGTGIVFRTVDENGSPPADQVTWEVVNGSVGDGDVTLETNTGPFTVITVKKPGIFILKVTALGRTPATIPITVVRSVVEPKPSGLKAFFLGDGYGTINLALFLMAAVAALGAIGVVGDGTVSTIFGAMAGYIFGIAVVSTKKSGGSGTDSET